MTNRHAVNFGHWYFPVDLAQGGEFFDYARDREHVGRLIKPFEPGLASGSWILRLGERDLVDVSHPPLRTFN